MNKRLGCCALMTAVLLAASPTQAAEQLRYTDYGPNRGSRAEAMEWFAKELASRTEEQVGIEYHWGGSLLDMRGTLSGVSSGVADVGTVLGFASPKQLRTYNLGDLPVKNSDIWVGLRAFHELNRNHPALKAEFDKQDLVYITNFSTGPIQLICSEDVTSLHQLRNMRVRASGPYADALRELGTSIEEMSQADVYQALDSGLITCNQNFYYSMLAYRQYEVAPYVLELDWGQNMAFGMFMNKFAFDRLTDDQQAALLELGDDFIDHFAEVLIKDSNEDKNKMRAGINGAGLEKISPLAEDQRRELMDASQQQVANWVEQARAEGLEADALLGTYQQLIDKYEQQRESEGYPWNR